MAHPNTREKDVPRAPPGRISGHTLTMPISHTESDRAIAKIPPPDISLEQQQLDLLGPAYVLDWTDQQRGCVRKRISGAEELRASIFQGEEDARIRGRRVFVIQGLPAEYLPVLRDELGVDVRFLEAHVARRAYTPLIKRSMRRAGDMSDASAKKAKYACFEYPELLTSARRMATTTTTTTGRQTSLDVPRAGAGGDIVSEAPTHVISNDGGCVMFCRASVWLGSKADVLLLDRPTWTRPSSEFRKAAYPSSGPVNTSLIPDAGKAKGSSVGSDTLHSEHTSSDRDEISSLETLLYQSLMEEIDEHVSIDQPTLIEDIAIHQWIEFFEALPAADLPFNSSETGSLYRQVQNSLERNLSQSEFRDKAPEGSYVKSSAAPAWESLLSRLSRRVSLLSYLNLPPTTITTTQSIPTSPSPSSSASNPRAQFAATGLPPQTSHRSPVASEQNQQSLDRVSYMGGILLPLSIVSSILSMSDPFNPGGSQFFVFWAVSIPLVVIAIIIIYADSIRKAEVWIEVASSSSNGSAAGEEKHDEEEEEGISMPEFEGRAGAPGLARRRVRTRMDGTGVGPGMVECESDDGYGLEEWDEPPGMMVEKMFKNAGKKKWRREQLGWMGACKAVFRIYKLKKGRPPNWATNVRRGNTV
ncbi:uncharacterized protein F4807DRAFT_59621 [Annulohypoxylon truncatum]|uniref:uncharacterized protein n=1 Tax=Annulohypoxylon truncatum TaxID=327061 RepID=UPI002007B95B|nr:uncharacterized protein F4807DRAFT_59621 [Annulohypoxylon truncatum]KAI1210285.1 hypothetical protein F4807DRAFT_59621 [Annulohypoxylon truncatum]